MAQRVSVDYDVVVIGAGPAGYVAAIRARQLGLTVACVDRWLAEGKPSPGGTCLNVGCIPSKALLDSTHLYQRIAKEAAVHGIRAEGLSVDVAAMQARKLQVVTGLTRGVLALFKKNGVEFIAGQASLLDSRQVEISRASGQGMTLKARALVLASGSIPTGLPGVTVDQEVIVDSTGALDFTAVPKRLGVIGAGVIGLELGSVWRRLGAEVVLLEAQEIFLPTLDRDMAREAFKALGPSLDIRLGARITGIERQDSGVEVMYEDARGAQHLAFDKCLLAVGRRPCTQGLNVERIGLKVDAEGFIEVDEHCRTNVDGVWAIGDVVRGPMLAHKGMAEGMTVAECLAGQLARVDYDTIPWVIYTWPEIAWVGQTEQSLRQQGIACRVGGFPFAANGRARALGEAVGRIKLIGEQATDRLLGAQMVGPYASELMAEVITALSFEASTEDLARTIHAHPSLAEAVHEAALALDRRAIHI